MHRKSATQSPDRALQLHLLGTESAALACFVIVFAFSAIDASLKLQLALECGNALDDQAGTF